MLTDQQQRSSSGRAGELENIFSLIFGRLFSWNTNQSKSTCAKNAANGVFSSSSCHKISPGNWCWNAGEQNKMNNIILVLGENKMKSCCFPYWAAAIVLGPLTKCVDIYFVVVWLAKGCLRSQVTAWPNLIRHDIYWVLPAFSITGFFYFSQFNVTLFSSEGMI